MSSFSNIHHISIHHIFFLHVNLTKRHRKGFDKVSWLFKALRHMSSVASPGNSHIIPVLYTSLCCFPSPSIGCLALNENKCLFIYLRVIYCCSVTQLCLTLRPHWLQHTRLQCHSLSPGVCSNSCPSNHLILCHSLFLPSIFPSIRVFPMSQLLASGGQSIGASASASVLPVNIQCREPAWEIPPMTRSCGETWWARRVRSQGVLCLSIYPETKICLFTVCYTILFWHNRGLSPKEFIQSSS